MSDGYQNDYQRAFAVSCSEREPRSEKLTQALKAGRYCVVLACPDHCPATDAVMGDHESLISDHGSRHEADVALANALDVYSDPDSSVYILSNEGDRLTIPLRCEKSDEDIPF